MIGTLCMNSYDVFRLLQIVTDGTKVGLEGFVTDSIGRILWMK